ncbi:hypothetical protein C7293_07550 [filamentous cyanobacterium CCT1]|nr:hypothetical protein C7293_07550 [filamentous cyanobacterium CCT1]PSN76711.1 hypothetical protein C8B47_25855 [filamentous cyanobacterium CCP4]
MGISASSNLLFNPWLSSKAEANQNYPTQANFEYQDDALELGEEGFQAIYIDALGNVLGTFVTVPGARLKVFANGQLTIDQRDFTTEITYFSNGRIRTLGDARFEYFSGGQISSINGIRFSYFTNGRLASIGDVRFS